MIIGLHIADSQAQKDAKRLKPVPRASRKESCEIHESISVNSNLKAGIPSNPPDDHRTVSAETVPAPAEDLLHEVIERTLPWEQPGLFPKEICDHLSAEHQDLILRKYSSLDSFRSTIHHILIAMLGQRKIERQSAKTLRGGRSHRYIRVRKDELDESRLKDKSNSTRLDVVGSSGKATTSCPDAESHAPTQTLRPMECVPATPVLPHSAKVLHNQGSVSSEVGSSSKQALSRPTGTNPEAPRTSQERTTPYDDGSTSLATTASEGEARNVIPEQRQHTQSQASHTTPSSGPKLPSSHVAVTQGTQASAGGLGCSSQTQGLPARVNITVHRSASVPSPEEAQKTKFQKPDGRGGFPVQVPMPPHACADNRIAKPALEDAPTEKLPASRITSGSITKLPPSHTSHSSRGGQWSGRWGGSHEQSSIPNNPPDVRQRDPPSLPSEASSKNASTHAQATSLMSHVPTPQVAVKNPKHMGQGYPAQHQIHTTATDGKQDRTPRPAKPPTSNHHAVSSGQVKSSFTAINSKGRSNVSASVLASASQVSVVGIAGVAQDATSKQNSVQPSKTNVCARDTARVAPAPPISDVMETLHVKIEMPNRQSGPGSGPSPHQILDGSPATEKRSLTASTQNAKPSRSIVIPEEYGRDLPSARSIDQTQQTAKVDATSTSDGPEKSHQTTHVESNHKDRSALELGELVKKARDVRKRCQKSADDVKVFELKGRNAQLVLDETIARKDEYTEKLKGLEAVLASRRYQIAKLEDEVEATRQYSVRSGDTAKVKTIECQAHAKAKSKAEKELSNTNAELQGLLQTLGIL
jgi:hypothetical protein